MAAALLPELQPTEALAWAHPVVQEWFLTKFGSATEPQEEGWPAILARRNNADLRAHRFRQNAGRIPGSDRSASTPRHRRSTRAGNAGRLRLAAQSALQRRAEEPRRPAQRDSATRRRSRLSLPADSHRSPHRRHAAVRTRQRCCATRRTSWSRRPSRSTCC